MTTTAREGRPRPSRWAALGGSALLTARLVAVVATLCLVILALCLILIVVGVYLLPFSLRSLRALLAGIAAQHTRRTGVELRVPAIVEQPDLRGLLQHIRYAATLLASRQTWVLLRWAALDSIVGIVIAVMPIGLVSWGLEGVIVLPLKYLALGLTPAEWYAFIPVMSTRMLPFAAILGAVLIVVGFFTGPWWLRLHGRWAAWLLGGDSVALRDRVDELTTSRADARHDAESELRRIEREVHDGTQSQLVGIGLKLGTAEMLLDDEPDRARAFIEQAREDSALALAELRDLMRGIRPPILADRGLGAALEALALDATTTVGTHTSLSTRIDPALETVAYFATRELVANAIKHGTASAIGIDARDTNETLAITVTDDGCGGAVVMPGHGLDGIRRRLGVFDGSLAIESPRGGPTTVRIEVPCAS
ncbi:MAG: histidine kinase [Pseudoclavibacter sp.]